jgi:transcriptional regulator with XRE-family HTH domain
MTQSRTRPVLNQSELAIKNEQLLPKGCDDISNALSDFLIETSEIAPNNQNYKNMNHKLHIVLSNLLKDKKQSARKAAKGCGVPLSTFNGYLKPDKHQIDPNHLMTLAKYFGVSVDYLLSGQDQSKSIGNVPTKKLFSRWVKLTIEEIAEDSEFKIKPEEK